MQYALTLDGMVMKRIFFRGLRPRYCEYLLVITLCLLAPSELLGTFSLNSTYSKNDRTSTLINSAEFFYTPLISLDFSSSFSSDFTYYPYLGDFLEERTLNNETVLDYSPSFWSTGIEWDIFTTGYSDRIRKEISVSPYFAYRWLKASVFYKHTDQLELTSSSGGGKLSVDWNWRKLRLQSELMKDFSDRLPASKLELKSSVNRMNIGHLTFDIKADYKKEEESYPYFNQDVRDIDQRATEEFSSEGNFTFTPVNNMTLAYSVDYRRNDWDYSVLEGESSRGEYLEGISKLEKGLNSDFAIDYLLLDIVKLNAYYNYGEGKSDYGNDFLDEETEEASIGLKVNIKKPNTTDSVACWYSSGVSSHDDQRDISSTRDLLSQSLRINTSVSPYPFLALEGIFTTHFVHIIYLKGALVGSNRWDKTYYLSTGYRFKLWGVEFSQRIPIVANYIIYDEPRELSSRNRIRRNLTLETRLEKKTELWQYSFSGDIGYEEYGRLVWRGAWLEQKTWAVTTLSFRTSLTMRIEPFDISGFLWNERKEAEEEAPSPTGTKREVGLSLGYSGKFNSNAELNIIYHWEDLTTSGKFAYPSLSCSVGFRIF